MSASTKWGVTRAYAAVHVLDWSEITFRGHVLRLSLIHISEPTRPY